MSLRASDGIDEEEDASNDLEGFVNELRTPGLDVSTVSSLGFMREQMQEQASRVWQICRRLERDQRRASRTNMA